MYNTILLVHLGATLFMCGLIWFVQLVHYPAFSLVGESSFKNYHSLHVTRISYIVIPVMLVELGSASALLSSSKDFFIWLNFFLLVFIWLSTFFVQVPIHNQLEAGIESETVKTLVNGNWIRTILWSLRAVLVLYITSKLLDA